MKKFQTKQQLNDHISKREYSQEFKTALENSIKAVEDCIKGGATPSYLIIAETRKESDEATIEFSLGENMPESDVCITAVSGESWRERVFVFGDSGNGVIIYERVPFVDENDTELQRKT